MQTLLRITALAFGVSACTPASNQEVVVQSVAGPGNVTVVAPAAGQLTVNWTADPVAFKYYVFQAASGGAFAFVASVLDPVDPFGRPPPTTYTATGLATGVQYCYKLQSAYPDGTTSDFGAQGCSPAAGTTIVVPLQSPTNFRSVNLATNGMGSVIAGNVNDPDNGFVEYIPLKLSVGTRIRGWRVRVHDSRFSGGSARMESQLMTTTDNQHIPTAIATSIQSSGTGAEETISGMVSIVAAPSTQYWISVYDAVGTATGFVRRLELDVN